MSESQQPSVEKMSEARPKAGDADENQIDGDDEVEQARHDQDENAGQQGDERRKVRERDVHGIPPRVASEEHDAEKWVPVFGETSCSRKKSTLPEGARPRQRIFPLQPLIHL